MNGVVKRSDAQPNPDKGGMHSLALVLHTITRGALFIKAPPPPPVSYSLSTGLPRCSCVTNHLLCQVTG